MKSKIELELPADLSRILTELEKNDLEAAIVGGTIRDYFLGLPCKADFDVEVRGDFEALKGLLPSKAKELKYGVLKWKAKSFEAEFCLPRVEKFKKSLGFNHSNFESCAVPDLSYKKAAKRRDFTINAMYGVFKNGKLYLRDPLGGLEDLKSKRLSVCSKNFYKDPVRVLRAIRFSILYDFKVPEDFYLPGIIDEPFYVRYESEKSKNPVEFIRRLLELHQEPRAVELESLKNLDFEIKKLKDLSELWFLSTELKEMIFSLSGIRIKGKKTVMSLKVGELKPEDLNPFVLNFLEQLSRSDQRVYNYLESQDRVDLSWDAWQKLCAIEVDYEGIEPSRRQIYKWGKILKIQG